MIYHSTGAQSAESCDAKNFSKLGFYDVSLKLILSHANKNLF